MRDRPWRAVPEAVRERVALPAAVACDPSATVGALQAEAAALQKVRAERRELQSSLVEAEARRDAILEELAATSADSGRTPLPFPPGLPPAQMPAGFAAEVKEVLASCDPSMSLDAVDCTEYPCMAWATTVEAPVDPPDFRRCSAWQQRFGSEVGMASAYLTTSDGGIRRVLGFYPLPSEATARRDTIQRARVRTREMVSGYRSP
jgi:hypothetical protein